MKHVLLMVVMFVVLSIVTVQAQVFTEDFESTPNGMTQSSTGAGTWGINSRVFSQGIQSDSAAVTVGDTTYLTTTTSFSTVGKYAIYLDFSHICKISLFDSAFIEVSNNNGTTWQRATGVHYLGTALYGSQTNRFTELSYGLDWGSVNPVTPEQSWWKAESFDISALAANSADVKVRFVLVDAGGDGAAGRSGWYIDDIVINAEVSEQLPPSITLNAPIPQDTVYTNGTVEVSASISDASGIDSAVCMIHVMPEDFMQRVVMVYDASTVDTFSCQIPFYGFGRTTNYYIKAWDGSVAHNIDSSSTYHYIAKNSPGGDAIVGDPTSTLISNYPFYTNWKDGRSQFLYTAAEINAAGGYAGPITSISLNVTTADPAVMNGFTIKVKQTSAPTLTAFEVGQFTTVYSPASYTVPALGWQTITFTTPFNWNGSSNIIFEMCFDNDAYTNYSKVQATAATGMTWGAYADALAGAPQGCSLTPGTAQANRPNIQLTITGSSDLTNDIGVANILNPNSGVLIGSNYDINVDLMNYGIDTITSAQINWTLDGVQQTAYTFGTPADSIFPGNLSDTITLGTKVGTAGTHHIAAWTILPNGSFDTDLMNDTAKFSFYGCASLLAGPYTIGGTGSDFATFNDAVLALNQCGISAAVTFNVNNGTYNEQIIINDVAGSSATNTITFQSTSLDSTTAILSYDALDANDNYVVKLNGTNNIIFKDLSFVALDSTFARVFDLTNYAHDISFNNNIIKTIPSTEDDDNMVLILATDTIGNNININNNALLNSALAIRLQAGDINATNWNISNNTISGHYIRGIELIGSSSANIMHNQISADTSSQVVGYVGILLSNSTGTPMVTKNMISTSKIKTGYGIAITASVFDTVNSALIANNLVNLNVNSVATNLSAGVINHESSNVNIYNNSLHFEGTQENSANIVLFDDIAGTSMNINIVNNNLTNNADGYLYYANNVDSSAFTVNNNNLYKFDGSNSFAYLGTAINDFDSWVTASGALYSTNIDPYFNAATGLHINNNLLNNTGTPLATVTDDINSVVRNLNNPDVSAYEFDAQPWDIIAIEVLSPMSDCGLTSTENVTVRFRNIGTSTITSFDAYYQLTGNATAVTETVTTSILAGDTLDYTFTTTVDLDVNTYGADSTFDFTAWALLTGDLVHVNDTTFTSVASGFVPNAPIVIGDTVNYGNAATLKAQGNSPYFWASNTATDYLMNDTAYVTPLLYDTTEYWVSDRAGSGIDTIVSGTGVVTSTALPMEPYYGYSYSQSIHKAINLGGISGSIESIKYHFAGGSVFTDAVKVYVAHTANNDFASTTSWLPNSNLTMVYDGTLTTTAAGGWIEIIFTQPFYYNGTDNLVIAFEENTGGYHSGSDEFYSTADADGDNVSIYYYNDNTNPDPASPPTGNLSVNFPNTKIVINKTGCFGPRVPVTAIVEDIPSVDASASAIVTPSGTISADNNHAMNIAITNFGTSTLTSANINYRVDNGATVTYSWTGSIAYQQTDTFNVGNISIAPGVHDIYSWTSNPNGVNDTINSNDTTSIQVKACLNGTYTIGDTTGGAIYDYPSFTAAVNILNTVGVCAPVIFTVDSGVYNERILIEEIDGASAVNTVTFTGLQGDSSVVTMQATNTYSINHIVKFDGADYVTFSHLGFKSNSTSYGKIFVISGGSDYITIKNNKLEGGTSTGSSTYIINGESSDNDNYTTIMNNHFINGSRAINLYGKSSTDTERGHIITNNFMENFNESSVYIYSTDSVNISNNRMESESMGTSTWTTYSIIYTGYTSNNIMINANTILAKAVGETIGINVVYNTSSAANTSIVSNNTVKIYDGVDDNVGLRTTSSTNVDFVYNTIIVSSSSNTAAAVNIGTSLATADITFINNIVSDSLGYALIVSGTGVSAMDHNSYHTYNSNFAKYNYADMINLGALQTASSMDANSVVTEADFVSLTDLHLANSLLAGLGTPVANITVDMDGDARGVSRTTIGADEKEMAQFDIGIKEILNLNDTINEGDISTPIIVVKNYGYDTITTFVIGYTVNNVAATPYSYTGNLAPGDVDTITLATFITPASNSIFCATTVLATDTSNYNDTRCHNFYGYPQKDALLIDIVKIDEACDMTYDTVKVQLTNIGMDTINGYNQTATTISYQSNNNTVVTEAYNTVVVPFDTVWYTFNTPVYVGTNNIMDSIYRINAWINFAGDSYVANDSIDTYVTSPHTPAVPTFTTPLSVVYATQAELNATSASNDSIEWFYDNTVNTLASTGNQFITPWNITQDTSMWLATRGLVTGFDVSIGTGSDVNSSTGYPTPFGNYWYGNKEQYLILASELTAMGLSGGEIAEIYFDVDAVNSCPTLNNYSVSIGTTSQSDMLAWEVGLVPVYNNNAYVTTQGSNMIEFAAPYDWDGVSNIVIEVCSNNAGYVSSGNASVKSTTTTHTSTLNYHADASGVCASSSVSTSYNKRPNIRLVSYGGGCLSPLVEFDVQAQAQSACDVAVINTVDLQDRVYLTSNEDITIQLVNFGSSNQATVPVSYTVNGGTAITESLSINANDTLDYTFTAQADLSAIGSYDFEFYTDLACDNVLSNDSFFTSINHLNPDYCVSMATSTYGSYIEAVKIENDSNVSNMPFAKDYTDNTSLGSLSTISPNNSYSVEIKVGASYSATGYVKVFIDFNRDGIYDPIADLAFGSAFTSVSSPSGIISGTINVDPNVNIGTTQMRVVAVTSGTDASVNPCGTYSYGETEDYLINIAPVIAQDAGIEQILNIGPLTDLASIPLNVRVRNFGFDPINSVDIVYEVTPGSTPITFVYSTVIPVGDSADVLLGMIPISMGQNNICVKTVLTGDDNYFNDQKCTNTFKQAFVNLAYTDSFENTDLWMVGESSTQWERGIPTMSDINTAHSPVNVWAIGLDTNYNNNSMEYLYSPKFNTVGINAANMSFWHNYQTENHADGGYVQYRINSDNWISLGYIGDTRATNWYTDATGGTNKFSGNSNGWIQSTYDFDFTAGEFDNCDTLQLRYVFYSTNSTNDSNGWAIDDFAFELPPVANDVGATAVLSPINTVQNGQSMTVTIDVENFGIADQASFEAWYQIGTLTPVNETFSPTGGLLAGTTQSFTFTVPATALSTDFIVTAGTNLTGDAYPQNDDTYSNTIIVTAGAIDAGITAIGTLQPIGGGGNTSILYPVVVEAEITNFGINTLTTINVEYSIDGGNTWFPETWTGSIATNEVDTFVFATTYNSPLGNYSLCVRTAVANDVDLSNDMKCDPYIGTSIKDANGIIFEVSQNEPNPAVGNVRINYIVPTNGEVNFELRNTLGQVIYTVEQASFTGKNTLEVDADKLANGVYYYSVIFDGQRITRKMIVNQ